MEVVKFNTRITGFEEDKLFEKSGNVMRELVDIKDGFQALVPPSKELYGFTINSPMVPTKEIVQKVLLTDIQNILKEDIEYIVTAKVCHYPNFILSIWIFVGILYKKGF
jgi:hypothetical protein